VVCAVLLGLSSPSVAEPVSALETAPPAEVVQGFGKPGLAPVMADSSVETAPPEEVVQGFGKPGVAPVKSDSSIGAGLERRLAERGMRIGSPVLIRIFKSEAELEVWMHAGTRFELFATYPICNWSGALGPKLTEGDKQSPEGLYSIGRRQLRRSARWHRSLDIGFPNAFDRSLKRTGSDVLLHGGCTSTGCYAMTDAAIEEIFRLSEKALARGQARIQVHAFPFRMTAENLALHASSEWNGFWANLREAYDLFERTRLPPSVRVCESRYLVSENDHGDSCPVRVSAVATPRSQTPEARQSADVPAARRRPGRNVMQAYAAARRARLAAKAANAKQRHASHASGQGKLPK
jgi:murein L,D-transpeptidase YafK